MSIQEKLFPWSVLINIIVITLIFWMWYENGQTKGTFQRDREAVIRSAELNQEKAQAKFDSLSVKIAKDSTAQAKRDSAATVKEIRLTGEIRHWKRMRSTAGVKLDTFTVVIEKKSDSLRAADSLQIVALKQEKLILREDFKGQIEAMTTKYLEQVTISDRWETDALEAERKLTRMEKIAKALGISAGTLAVVVAVLAIAL